MTDTWGIPGPTFLWIFTGLALALFVWTIVRRRRLFAGPDRVRVDSLAPSYVAYLTEGPQRAAYASLAWLRRANAVDIDHVGRLSRLSGVPAGANALDSAVLHAAGQGVRGSQVQFEQSVASALGSIRDDLTRQGLLVSEEDRRAARMGAWLLLGLTAVGLLRLGSGVAGGKPVLFLVLALLVVAPISLLLLRTPRITAAAKRALAQLRKSYQHLSLSHKPAFQTYDPVMTGMAVGLFGGAVLLSADPALAEGVGVRDVAGSAGYTGSYGGGDSGSSGGGDGGGGGGGCGG